MNVNPILFIISLLVTVTIFVVTESFATFGIAIIIFLLLFATIILDAPKSKFAINTILLTYCIYTTFAILHYYQIDNNELDPTFDEVRYFIPFVNDIISQNISFDKLWIKSLQYNFGEHHGYLFYIGSFALFGKICLGDYNVMQLLLSSVLIGCLYSIFLFKVISIYTDEAKAFKYTLFYMLCTPIVMSSYVVLRDLLIALIYLIGIYIILKNTTLNKGLPIFILSFLLLLSLRLEHALFFALFIIIYIYRKYSRYKVISISLFAISSIIFFAAIQSTFLTMSDTLATFNEYTITHANQAGLAMKLLSLPSPIKEVACSLFSQIFPIPPWVSLLDEIKSVPDLIFSLLSMVKTICWFYIAFYTVKYIFTSYKKIKIFKLGFLLIASIILIVTCSSEYYESRRIMCIYPVIYITFILFRQKIPRIQTQKTTSQFFLVYGSVIAAYYLMLEF